MNKNLLSTIVLVSISLLVGCAKKDSPNSGNPTVDQAASLNGNWMRKCYKKDKQGADDAILVSQQLVTKSTRLYADSGCGQPMLASRYTATFPSLVDSRVVRGAKEWDQTLITIEVAAISPEMADFLTGEKYCGYSQWRVGEYKDVADRKCGNTQMAKAGDKRFDVFSIRNGLLYTGRIEGHHDGKALERRPQALDTDKPFQKQ